MGNFPSQPHEAMTTTELPRYIMSKSAEEALVDQLRACQSKTEILGFEKLFNSKSKDIQLHEVICEFLKKRSISRAVAARWLLILINDKSI